MIYKDYKDGIKLSVLGMGNMRLPVCEDKEGRPIDYAKAKALIDAAMTAGINYYDTAYIYHGGESEVFTGRALREYPRDSYYVATKFNLDANPDYRAQFAEQLDRLGMDYIDFYLLHGIMDHNADAFFENGAVEYFDEMKAKGKIRYFGFSFHGTPDALRKLVARRKWDFVQIQLNYYDWLYGDAKTLYGILEEAGIPVMVMEPVRGGLLAKLTEESAEILTKANRDASLASWALRWVKALSGVQVTLSGMTTMEQLLDNIRTMSSDEEFSMREQLFIENAAQALRSSVSVPCTGCRYCTDDCPMGLDIPRLLATYNEVKLGGPWRLSAIKDLPDDKLPAACVGCGACVGHCPQSIKIPAFMKEMAKMMAPGK